MNTNVIRKVHGTKWNEDDRLSLGQMLLKAGYTVRIHKKSISNDPKDRKEYVVEYWEDEDE